MILLLVLGYLCCATATTDVLPIELQPPNCNCSHFLNEETTDITPTFPTTSFTCWGRYDGYYADIEVDCTIFHYCQTWTYPSGLNETVKWDFACPQSTVFNQKILSCTPPSISFDCQESPNYYWVNYNLTTTTTTSPAPTPEVTTPHNLGQQLIVGGLEEQSASIQDSNTTPSNFEESDTLPNSEFELLNCTHRVTSLNVGDSGFGSEISNEGNDSEAIKFPM